MSAPKRPNPYGTRLCAPPAALARLARTQAITCATRLAGEAQRQRLDRQGLNQRFLEFDNFGHLPKGVHDCTLPDIKARLGWNSHRQRLVDGLIDCVQKEIRPHFQQPVIVDGSFVTDKPEPVDVDIVLDLQAAPSDVKWRGFRFLHEKARIDQCYGLDFWVNIPGLTKDFSRFFQYLGDKNAGPKGLNPKSLKGILRVM